ncbi:MAG: phosphoribosyl transferase protein [Candidatus Peribacteria bacterium]|nr:phosphoribosyl transferase protein [Candidatus Peribacteria bacterium]
MIEPLFTDREQAGYVLSDRLESFNGQPNVLVFGLIRGGMPVAKVIADKLHVPAYPYIVRKIGHPDKPEYGVGAIAEGGETYLDENLMRTYGLTWESLEPVIEKEMAELRRRKEIFGSRSQPDIEGKIIILVDDGAATGGSMLAAIGDISKAGAEKIIVALPVAPMETMAFLRQKADDVIVLRNPMPFHSVGEWYENFPQLEDEDVLALI